eukprot:CAMPEP_0117430342 /NCGR_PEP_ID=MMETSP0758-20121206/9869_1 /TAXON_ID=63605 /ORGANISM="Percolomonas cosmopolitus, Strain AE-1 (ATCC 50343)" /LENGTH=537 /DNA_ID=CAMNT_0005218241 /DNA_START=320 /DNA_END=1930 /DNA_ORIENTATION=+
MVSRTCLSLLQDLKLGYIVPFHKNIVFHRFLAYWVAVCGLLHGGAHYFNYACCVFQYFAVPAAANAGNLNITPVKLPDRLNPALGNPEPNAFMVQWIPYSYADWVKTTKYGLTGNLLWIVMVIMYSASNKSFRRTSNFTYFWFIHHLFIVFFVLLLVHGKKFWVWFLGPGFLYVLERVVRIFRGAALTTVARVESLPGRCFVFRIDKPAMQYKAGQYCFINVPLVSRHEWHPFTISSSPRDRYLSFHIRGVGDWTQTVAKTLNPEGGEVHDIQSHRAANGRTAVVRVDGPFGTDSDFIFDYSTVCLIACGIGVTPFSSILSDLLHRLRDKETGSLKTKKVFFYWLNRGDGGWQWFGKLLNDCEHQFKDIFDIITFMTGDIGKDDIEHMTYTSEEYMNNRSKNLQEKDGDRVKALRARVKADYAGTGKDEIEIKTGDIIEISFREKSGWWLGRNERTGKTGQVPSNYMDIIDEKTKMANTSNRRFGRPQWQNEFDAVRDYVSQNRMSPKVGVFFCGPAFLSKNLRHECYKASQEKDGV